MARSRGSTSIVSDPVIEAYKPGVDATLVDLNFKKTFEQRLDTLWGMQEFFRKVDQIRERPVVQFWDILTLLAQNRIDFIVIGGVAATLHGSAIGTNDLDVIYSRKKENLARIVEALRPYQPYPRGAPPGLPFQWDVGTLTNGLNFTLTTTLGPVDLLGEVVGGGRYEDVLGRSFQVQAYGVDFRCIDLDTLIAMKRAAGRPRDFNAIAELEIIRERTRRS